jgi:competence protein ComEC
MPGRLAAVWLGTIALAAGAWLGTGTMRWTTAALGLTCLCCGLCFLRRRHAVVLGAVCVASFSMGLASASLRSGEGRDLEALAERTRSCEFSARVIEHAGGLGTLMAIETASCTAGPLPSGNVFWDAAHPPPVGTLVSGRGWITRLGDDEFARARRAAGGRALLIPEVQDETSPSGLWGAVGEVRGAFRGVAESNLDPRAAALLLGITVGETDGFNASDLEAFRASGLSHVLAVSGSNVALVLAGVAAFTRRAPPVRRVSIMLASIGAFVVLVGPDGSVLRAGVMGAIAVLAGGWIRPVDPRYSLPFALLVLIAARPTLVTSAGLHLSAAATMGIVLWSRSIAGRLAWLPKPVAAVLAVTIAAQLAVAPLLAGLFGRLSLVAPLSNLLAAPAIAAGTILGLLACLLCVPLPGVAGVAVSLARFPLAWVMGVAERSAALGWAEIAVPSVGAWALAALVAVAAGRALRRPTAA